jgi:hypothetical protein
MKAALIILISFFSISCITMENKIIFLNTEDNFNYTKNYFTSSKINAKKSTIINDCGHYIGERFGGGIIFYLDSTGCHGLIAAPYDQARLSIWANGVWNVNEFAYQDGVGAGQANTKMLVLVQEPHAGQFKYAAKICDDVIIDAYNDWYMPSKYELNLMFYNIGQGAPAPNTNIGNFQENWYWSSTEADSTTAWRQAFIIGLGWQNKTEKFYDFGLRAVRLF